MVSDFRFGSKAKMSQSAPHFLPTFYVFPGRFSYTLQHIKDLETQFSVSPKYGLFSLSTWSKNKNFDLYHKTSIIHFLKINNFYFMVKVKILIFWPCWKWKLAIFCRNGKLGFQIFYMLLSMWKSTRKDIKRWKKVGGRLTHFCLGPKSKIARHGTVLAVRSQVLVTGISAW